MKFKTAADAVWKRLQASKGKRRCGFWVAVLPASLAVAIVAFALEEPKPLRPTAPRRFWIRRTDLARLHRAYWLVVALAALMNLARFSQAFLLLRAGNVGLSVAFIPSVLIAMNAFYAVSAYPFGSLSDRLPRRRVVVLGAALLLAANLVLAAAQHVPAVFLGAALWGLHLGATQGLLSALVADSCPDNLRGTAFGIFNLVKGAALLLASIVAGWLWVRLGPSSTFIAGATFAGFSLMGITAWALTKGA